MYKVIHPLGQPGIPVDIKIHFFCFVSFTATAFGKGVYFAKDPHYSLQDTYTPRDSNGHKHLYMCNVLTGMFCRGDHDMKVLPENPLTANKPYNSAVNDINNPTIFVIFHDASAYPAYLITCA